jgi:hypothetical protein
MAVTDRLSVTRTFSPGQHAVLDYAVAATFFGLALRYRRRRPAASLLAFLNGGMVLGMSLLTDYPGGVWPRISFRTHGTLDVVQAAVAGLGPVVLGFADTPEATVFYTQAASEFGVIGMTDWDSGTQYSGVRS